MAYLKRRSGNVSWNSTRGGCTGLLVTLFLRASLLCRSTYYSLRRIPTPHLTPWVLHIQMACALTYNRRQTLIKYNVTASKNGPIKAETPYMHYPTNVFKSKEILKDATGIGKITAKISTLLAKRKY
jgi:hypothetical protein